MTLLFSMARSDKFTHEDHTCDVTDTAGAVVVIVL